MALNQRSLVSVGPSGAELITVPEATGQSFKKGDLVYRASGLATACGDAPAQILGFAQKDASTVANTPLLVEVIHASTRLRASVYHGTGSSAVTAQAQLGNLTKYPLKIASNTCYIDIQNSSNKIFLPVIGGWDLQMKDVTTEEVVGDQYGTLVGNIAAANLEIPYPVAG